MSRSYKHHPFCTDRKHGAKWWKSQANRKVRHTFNIPNGKAYRKVYNPWNIRDYVWYESRHGAAAWYNRYVTNGYDWWREKYPTFEDYMNNCWAHDFYRK